MKIAVIDLMFNWPPDGGARVDIKEVTERLAASHDVRLFVPDDDFLFPRGKIDAPVPFPVEPVKVNGPSLMQPFFRKAMGEAVRKFDPDVIYFGDGYHHKPRIFHELSEYPRVVRFYAYETLCLRAHGVLFRRGWPCGRDYLDEKPGTHAFCLFCAFSGNRHEPLFMHEFMTAGAFTRKYMHETKRMLNEASGLVCYNELIASRLRPHNNNVRIVPSGIDPFRFKGEWKPASGRVNISLIGRALDPLKGLDTLVKACEVLAERRNDFELRFTVERGLSSNLKRPYITPYRWHKPEELPQLYEQMDICVVPSLWDEPFGIVALEAMASARPVVVTRVGGLQEIITEGETGYIVDRRDHQTMADRLEQLIEDAALRRRMGETGRQEVLNKYQWDHIVETHYEPLFHEIHAKK